jgi:hypothetical protein
MPKREDVVILFTPRSSSDDVRQFIISNATGIDNVLSGFAQNNPSFGPRNIVNVLHGPEGHRKSYQGWNYIVRDFYLELPYPTYSIESYVKVAVGDGEDTPGGLFCLRCIGPVDITRIPFKVKGQKGQPFDLSWVLEIPNEYQCVHCGSEIGTSLMHMVNGRITLYREMYRDSKLSPLVDQIDSLFRLMNAYIQGLAERERILIIARYGMLGRPFTLAEAGNLVSIRIEPARQRIFASRSAIVHRDQQNNFALQLFGDPHRQIALDRLSGQLKEKALAIAQLEQKLVQIQGSGSSQDIAALQKALQCDRVVAQEIHARLKDLTVADVMRYISTRTMNALVRSAESPWGTDTARIPLIKFLLSFLAEYKLNPGSFKRRNMKEKGREELANLLRELNIPV